MVGYGFHHSSFVRWDYCVASIYILLSMDFEAVSVIELISAKSYKLISSEMRQSHIWCRGVIIHQKIVQDKTILFAEMMRECLEQ